MHGFRWLYFRVCDERKGVVSSDVYVVVSVDDELEDISFTGGHGEFDGVPLGAREFALSEIHGGENRLLEILRSDQREWSKMY